MNFWKSGFMGNYIRRVNFKAFLFIEYIGTLHLDSIHVRNLVFGMYLPHGQFHKSDFQILKILLFFHFIGKKLQKMAEILDFFHFLAVFCL